MTSGVAHEPQDENAPPPDFAVASKYSLDVGSARLPSNICGMDIERPPCWLIVTFPSQKSRQSKKPCCFHALCLSGDSGCSAADKIWSGLQQ
ncbi:hypothetical protein [Mesorhizobium onobrychidis]|uniref:Uncharacterized protein n=1 Tax=Mesorhizobium onobrychidis TaxID=2775404 RepID=A0ABY5QWT6_9HYPH|nr:hypothetical protein [Mesorhizobium onobrychidis]UVC15394.1 hypothetical protein IHQ72_33820 [Mesorhizobium onobrychidis]